MRRAKLYYLRDRVGKAAKIKERRDGPLTASAPFVQQWSRDRHAAMSAEEDLDQFEAEIELALYQEYRAVLPMFRYVVETERRFYLANEVKVDAQVTGRARTYFEVELARRLGWDMYRRRVRLLGASCHLQGRERRGAAKRRGLVAPSAGRSALGRQGEDATAHWYVAHGYEVVAKNWRCRTGEIDLICRRARGSWSSAR